MVDLSEDAKLPRQARLDEALELLHFAFRKIVERPDQELAKSGMGRVHHRILYFVGRNPGLRVGDLLDILGVTKQALHGPLLVLVTRGFVERRRDPANQRVKRLVLTKKGAALERRLTGEQRRRFEKVFRACGPRAERAWREVMSALASRPIPARPPSA
jgi:DNA-binding MarR family transcriptional regulator